MFKQNNKTVTGLSLKIEDKVLCHFLLRRIRDEPPVNEVLILCYLVLLRMVA